MSTTYGITISMDQNTVDSLSGAGYCLFAFKAVQGPTIGVPLVWLETSNYAMSTPVSWQELYQAYSSTSPILNGAMIEASYSYAVDLGDRFTITSSSGAGSVTTDGSSPTGVDIYNMTTTQFACGISQQNSSGTCNPVSAFLLYGQMQDTLAPVEQVMLMFSIAPVNTGGVMIKSDSQCVMIDLSTQSSRTVIYKINFGWDTSNQSGMKIYPPNTDLSALLIQPYSYP
jgi:hypothetical protein